MSKQTLVDYNLTGKTAIVSGAASGMGKATSLYAARLGMQVVCLDISDPEETVAEITSSGGAAIGLSGDVSEAKAWEAALQIAEEKFGNIYLLGNIAGITPKVDSIVDQSEEGWARVIDVNLKSVWLGMKHAVPKMTATGGGRIVNVASVAGFVGLPNLAAYTASKAGVAGITRQGAIEYGRAAITVNAIAPGVVDTPMIKDNPPEMTNEFLASTPSGRAGTAEEVAALIMFLASGEAGYINGQTIAIDGGWSVQG